MDAHEKDSSRTHDVMSVEDSSSHSGEVPDLSGEVFADRYRIVQPLGSGGMGVIYKAYDTVLRRYAALKLVRVGDPQLEQRLLREARAQARVEHKSICQIYDLGHADKKPYIAMQFIDGQSLQDAHGSLDVQQKAMLMRQVAEAIHAAHRQGLIHRDLKPSNIMIEYDQEETLCPYVLDFGLVSDITQPNLSQTGAIHGTPSYMAPEQAMGAELDRRTDVYGLGATFYYLLAHRAPFEGTLMEIITKVLQEDPPNLRSLDSSIPIDLETIVMKCLEKERNRRYESARDLAEDLQRYLDGEPIQAHPVTISYRVKKAIKRNRLPVGIGAAAFALVVTFLAMWAHARWQAGERAQLAQQLGEKVMQVESNLRQIYTLPLHDVRNEKAAVQREMEVLTGRILGEMGKIGKGPGNYALGRTYFLLQDYEKARRHLELAWDDGYRVPAVSILTGRVLGELYQHGLAAAERIENARTREARIQEIEKEYRDPAISHLHAAREFPVESPEYVEALVAFYRGDLKLAMKRASEAREKSPWLYEASLLQGAIHVREGSAIQGKGDRDGAIASYKRAIEAYNAAIRVGESDVRGYQALCGAWAGMLVIELDSREREIEIYRSNVLQACGNAQKVDPDWLETQILLARASRFWGRYEMYHGRDPSGSFQQALQAAGKALSSKALGAEAYEIMANVYWHQGTRLWMEGKDPVSSYQAAIESAEKSLAIHPNFFDSQNTLGLACLDLGRWQVNTAKDPGEPLDKSIQAFSKAVEIDSSAAVAVLNMGIAFLTQGEYLAAIGKDPSNHLNRAIGALEKNPSAAEAYVTRGVLLVFRARTRSETEERRKDAIDAGDAFLKAFSLNGNLRSVCESFVEEARNLTL